MFQRHMQHFCYTEHHSQIKRKRWSIFVRTVIWVYVGDRIDYW